jgi:hypothetical protein
VGEVLVDRQGLPDAREEREEEPRIDEYHSRP